MDIRPKLRLESLRSSALFSGIRRSDIGWMKTPAYHLSFPLGPAHFLFKTAESVRECLLPNLFFQSGATRRSNSNATPSCAKSHTQTATVINIKSNSNVSRILPYLSVAWTKGPGESYNTLF
ncbi:hypothetical protein ABKN59_009471 [Abortiporus biennis]